MTAPRRRWPRRTFVAALGAVAVTPLLGGCRATPAAPTRAVRVHVDLSGYERAFFERSILPAIARDLGIAVQLVEGNANAVIGRLGDPQVGVDLIAVDLERLGTLIATGLLLPLDETRPTLQEPIWQGMLPALTSGGKLYAVPYRPSTWVTYYNRATLAAAQLAPPQTWEDFLVAATRLTESQAPARAALQGAAGDPAARTLIELIWAFGGDPLAPTSNGALRAGEFAARLRSHLAPLSPDASISPMTTALGTGTVAIGPNWPWVAADMIQRGGQTDITAYVGPSGPSGGARLLAGPVMVVPRYSADLDGALRIAAYLRAPATQATLARELAWLPSVASALDAVPTWQREVAITAQTALRGARTLPPLGMRSTLDEALGEALRAILFNGEAASTALARAAGKMRGLE